ncbi:DUF3107 domain-containing protein [Schaalia sp. Marseille-Q2122]|uniref:DUF3107 domain-containing protein n=1 Tax=Schaalia sp. Marseille-Q2122 TaxID=2736604 RepID=UPI00158C20D1|nr:DUF3107 domain-containing protein [Schaalia sp. Marseille-Q2122]
MKVTIGVRNVARELILDLDSTADDFAAQLTAALNQGTVLDLTDAQGQRVLIPADAIGFTQIGSEEPRRVGFAL